MSTTETTSSTTESPVAVARQRSRVGTTWLALGAFAVLLLFLMVFVIQNSKPVEIKYFGANGTIGFGVAMLLSAIAGVMLTLLIGSARILQLKVSNKRHN